MLANRQAFRIAENQSRLQENARAAFELLAHDIRAAGGNACGANQVSPNNLINSANLWWVNWAGGPLRGFANSQVGDAAQGIVPVGVNAQQRLAGSDAVIVMNGNTGDSIMAAQHNAAAAPPNFRVTSAQHGLAQNDIVMICDEFSTAIFQVTNAATNTTTIQYAAGGAAPGNIAANLGTSPDVGGGPAFSKGATIARLHSAFWYVGPNGRGSNSLYRLTVEGQPIPRTDEIVEGVAGLQLEYVQRDPSTGSPAIFPGPPAVPSNWLRANNPAIVWAPSVIGTRVDGMRIEAVRVRLFLQSRDAVGVSSGPQTAQRLTTELNQTIYLRNREYIP